MGKRIEYKEGQILGGHGCVFLNEEPRRRYGDGREHRMGKFLCRCGVEFTTMIRSVKSGGTQSCGCYMRKTLSDRFTTHGLIDHPLHQRWADAKDRCYNKNNKKYERYGGRGIIMCDEWKNNFQVYYDYMIGLPNAMRDGYSIDREDNDGNYEPGNMRWATGHMQSVNQAQRKDNKSGYTGVFYRKTNNNWQAQITVNKKVTIIGYYSTALAAAEARDWYIIKNGLWEYKLQVVKSG